MSYRCDAVRGGGRRLVIGTARSRGASRCRRSSPSCPCRSTATSPTPTTAWREVFDWYFSSGDVEIHTGGSDPMTFRVSEPSAEHLRSLTSELGAVLTGRRTFEVADGWGGNHAWGPAFVLTHHVPDGWPRPGSTVHFVTDGIESAVAQAKAAAGGKSVGGPRRRHHPAVPERRPARRDQRRHRGGPARLRSPALRPPRRHAGRPRQPDGDAGRRRDPPALPRPQGVGAGPRPADGADADAPARPADGRPVRGGRRSRRPHRGAGRERRRDAAPVRPAPLTHRGGGTRDQDGPH